MSILIDIGLTQFGIAEIPGKIHNPEVLKYYHETGHKWVSDDETPWCSAFLNWVAMKAGLAMTGLLNARSWLEVGIEVMDPKPGDVAILWRVRPDSQWGHVGIVVRVEGDRIWLLGGNQSNQVCIQDYPIARVIGYRQLQKTA